MMNIRTSAYDLVPLLLLLLLSPPASAAAPPETGFDSAVSSLQQNEAHRDLLACRRECDRGSNIELCKARCWLKYQIAINPDPAIGKGPGGGLPPELAPHQQIIRQLEEEARDLCEPHRESARAQLAKVWAADDACRFDDALRAREEGLASLPIACHQLPGFDGLFHAGSVILDRQRKLRNALREADGLMAEGEQALVTCGPWDGALSAGADGILSECRPEVPQMLVSLRGKASRQQQDLGFMQSMARTAISQARTAVERCASLDEAASALDELLARDLLKNCDPDLWRDGDRARTELGAFRERLAAFERRAGKRADAVAVVLESCSDLEASLKAMQETLQDPLAVRCESSDAVARLHALSGSTRVLLGDLESRRASLLSLLAGGDGLIRRCDWKGLERLQSRASDLMPRAECVQNSPGFEALHAEFADLDGRRRQRETVVRPYRERLHVQTVKTRGYLRPFEEDSATQGGTWTANAQKHYNAERDRLRAILDDTQAAGLTDCLSSYIAKAEAVLRQEPPQQQAKTPECEVDTHCPSPDQICVKGKCVADDSPFIVFDEAGRRSDQRSDRGEARSQPRPDKTTPSEKKPEPATADNGFDWRKLDDAAFVTHLYATILDRKPDPGGFRHWMGHLKRKRTRDWIMDYFFSSPEYQSRNKSNRDFVIDLYQATHNREPKSGEMSQALARLKRGTTRKDMVDSAQSR